MSTWGALWIHYPEKLVILFKHKFSENVPTINRDIFIQENVLKLPKSMAFSLPLPSQPILMEIPPQEEKVKSESVSHSVMPGLFATDPMDCRPLGSPVHWILQAWILEWVAIPFFRGPSWPRDQTPVSHIIGRSESPEKKKSSSTPGSQSGLGHWCFIFCLPVTYWRLNS